MRLTLQGAGSADFPMAGPGRPMHTAAMRLNAWLLPCLLAANELRILSDLARLIPETSP